jgi:hypothetical protein
VDSSLRRLSPADKIIRYIQIGLLCVQDDPAQRLTMSTVSIMLNSTDTLRDPFKPVMVDLGHDAPATSTSATQRFLS